MTQDWTIRAEAICMHCGGKCCTGAHPPLSRHCHERLLAAGVPPDVFEWRGYRTVRTRDDGSCMLSSGSRCSIHGFKPETCRAGPFTFDVRGDQIEIFLKKESICPVVGLLTEEPEAYAYQYAIALRSITSLVTNLEDSELETICRIEEPDTVKVAEVPRVRHDHRH